MTSVSRQILPTVLPGIMENYGLNSVEAGLITSFQYVGIFFGCIFFGIYSDYSGRGYKRSRPWAYTVILAAIAGVAVAYSKSIFMLKSFLVFLGIGTGGAEPINVAIIGEWWPKEHRGFAVGFHHIGFPIGQFVGPVMIGFVLAVGTWQDAFIFIPLLAIPLVVAQLYFGSKKYQKKMLEWVDNNNLTRPDVDDLGNENLKPSFKQTLSDMVLCLKNKNCLYSITVFFIFLYVEVAIMTFLTLQLTSIGLSLEVAAIISGASGLTGWIGQIFWGIFSDIFGRKLSLFIIGIGTVVAVFGCLYISSESTGWLCLILWGLFRNSPYPVTFAVMLDSLPKGAGSALGIMIGFSWLVSSLCGPINGYIIQNFGFTYHYIFLACLTLFALIFISLIKETVKRRKAN